MRDRAFDIIAVALLLFSLGVLAGYAISERNWEIRSQIEHEIGTIGVRVLVGRNIDEQYVAITGTLEVDLEDAIIMAANSEGTWRLYVDGGLEETTRQDR